MNPSDREPIAISKICPLLLIRNYQGRVNLDMSAQRRERWRVLKTHMARVPL